MEDYLREAVGIQAFGGIKNLSKARGYLKRMRQALRLRSGQAADLAAKRGKPGESTAPGESAELHPKGRREKAIARLSRLIKGARKQDG